MPITYRHVDSKDELLADADTIGYLKGLVADFETGRYTVDEISTEPGPSGHTSRRWGVLLKLRDGTVVSEPEPWEA